MDSNKPIQIASILNFSPRKDQTQPDVASSGAAFAWLGGMVSLAGGAEGEEQGRSDGKNARPK